MTLSWPVDCWGNQEIQTLRNPPIFNGGRLGEWHVEKQTAQTMGRDDAEHGLGMESGAGAGVPLSISEEVSSMLTTLAFGIHTS